MPIQHRPIRESGVRPSALAFDASALVHADGAVNTDAASLIDSAVGYGMTHIHVGTHASALASAIASAIARPATLSAEFHADGWDADQLVSAVDELLEKLARPSIDVVFLTNPTPNVVATDGLWGALEALRASGRVGAFGVWFTETTDLVGRARTVTQQHDIDVIAHPHHLLDQASGREVIELAAMSNIALFATDPLAGDRLTGSGERAPVEAFQFVLEDRESATLAQVAIKWLLADPQTATVVVTATTNEDLAERAASCDVEEFDADELGELATLHDLSFGVALA